MAQPLKSIDDVLGSRNSPPDDAAVFGRFYPYGTFEETRLRHIPLNALEHFEGNSARHISPEKYNEGNFERLFIISRDDSDVTYSATQFKSYDEGNVEQLTYFFEVDGLGKYVGHGELRFNLTNKQPFFRNKPFVGYTRTADEYQRRGRGLRRLHLMNAFAHLLHRFPLYSSTSISEEARKVWLKLAEKGEARPFKEDNRERFVFVN